MTQHGTPWSFRVGCRCDDCKKAWNRKNKRWNARALANGGRTTVDATELIPILTDLARDRSQNAVANMIGTSQSYVGRVLRGEIKRVGIDRANAIRRLRRDIPNTGAYVSSLGARRRLQALTTLGYSTYALSDATGVTRSGLSTILNGQVDLIHGHTHHKIADAYERHAMRLPVGTTVSARSGITRAQRRGAEAGWPAPLAWTDIDDPHERPKGSQRRKLYDNAELAAEWAHFQAAGETMTACAKSLGVTVAAIEKALERGRRAAA